MQFIKTAIAQHKQSEMYAIAADAEQYVRKRNVTITKYQKLLYTVSGRAVPDNYSANHKVVSNFFGRFVTQENQYLLGNGVILENPSNKKKLGARFDNALQKAGQASLVQGVSFCFWNFDHLEVFKLTEFVPLYDEENGALTAGIRFWQIAGNKPLRATLYEMDGYTEYINRKNSDMEVLKVKSPYKYVVAASVADGTQILDGENYPGFPIIPLWGSPLRQSELVGLRQSIDCYDLIKSGFANDLDDASMMYWTLENAGGMDDVDLAKFIQRMKTVKAAVIDGEEGSKAESHTMEIPYASRVAYLDKLKDDMYEDFQALDVKQLSSGPKTATEINAAYEPLNSKADQYEYCVLDFLYALFDIVGIEDNPTFKRSRIANQTEETQMILMSRDLIGDSLSRRKLSFLTPEEIEEAEAAMDAEELDRFDDGQGNETADSVDSVATPTQAVDNAEDAVGKTLNGAQTQSLIAVMGQLAAGALSEGQAVNVIATAIGVSKEEARTIIRGE